MTFERPTLAKLIRRAKADIMTRLRGADGFVRGSPEEVLAIVLSGMTHGLHGHLKWLSKQLLADLAEDEFLLRIAFIYGLEPTAAVAATGPMTITGTNTSVCPAGTVWQRNDGVRYTQDANATISSGTASVALTAVVAGAAGNFDSGGTLQLAAPVSGINTTGTLSADVDGGTDVETIEALRARLLLRLRNPPKGGGPGDYVNWALEVAGVTRAWEYPLMNGLGTVGVRFVRDNDGSGAAIIPSGGEVTTVQTHIDSVRPVTADVTVLAPVAVTMAMTLHIVPDTADIRAAVQANVEALLLTLGPGDTIYLSQLNEAISQATGETDHTLTVPAADVTHAAGELGILGTITWS